MITIEHGDAVVAIPSEDRILQFVVASTDQMPHRVATQRITSKQYHIDRQNDCADSNSEVHGSCCIREPESLPDIVGKEKQEKDSEIKKISMNILNDQRKRSLAAIAAARLAYGACWRIGP